MMKLFVIHRFQDNQKAKKIIKQISKEFHLQIEPIFLYSYRMEQWKEKAEKAIYQSEAVIIFNPLYSRESENVQWEIEKAHEARKEIIELNNTDNSDSISKLILIYNMKEEFETCFSSDSNDVMDLYKIMIQSSEQLILRRQTTNAFFITVIGSLLAIASLLVTTGALNGNSLGLLYGFSVIGLLLCNSWRNLIDNYGKLNKAKFDVILRLEKNLSSQIYSAEWIALGKGMRSEKYKSFTSTEKNVPLFFGVLITVLTIAITVWLIVK
ncbi:hypothetical protein [Paenibacillus sp. V4I7]|uniref:RipA family octameric membrane protein n=1 Tax=Paenibacillus sp. V4I7 TaxID=3042307 RepID=UPI002787E0AB|nr:hypothetical protein [Paenibacillus sp. V4I7]MDQ0898429.1 hypothetical protein [Paenibacillus sp. V4I7]